MKETKMTKMCEQYFQAIDQGFSDCMYCIVDATIGMSRIILVEEIIVLVEKKLDFMQEVGINFHSSHAKRPLRPKIWLRSGHLPDAMAPTLIL